MKNIESPIFTAVKDAVTAEYPFCVVRDDQSFHPEKFPCVVFYQYDSKTYVKGRTLCDTTENFTTAYFQADVYADNLSGAKALAFGMASCIDSKMLAMGFTCKARKPSANVNRSVYRYHLQYEGIVDSGRTAQNGNTTYLVY